MATDELRETVTEGRRTLDQVEAVLTAVRLAAAQHLGKQWEPLVQEVGKQLVKMFADHRGLSDVEGVLELAMELGLIRDYEVEEGRIVVHEPVELRGWSEVSDVTDVCLVLKGMLVEGFKLQGERLKRLEESVEDGKVVFEYEVA